jgi:hypothetical protein
MALIRKPEEPRSPDSRSEDWDLFRTRSGEYRTQQVLIVVAVVASLVALGAVYGVATGNIKLNIGH